MPAGLSPRLAPAPQQLAGLSQRSGPQDCPNGCAMWPVESAPVLAEAATAPRKTDTGALAIKGRGGGNEGAGGGPARGREG
eukprot:5688347-Pyramimonas_sp.AAC.2